MKLMGDSTMMHIRRGLGVAAATTTLIGLLLPMEAAVAATCAPDDNGTVMSITADCTLDSTLQIPNGRTFDGNNFTITANPGLSGAVIESAHGTAGTGGL